MDQAPRRRLLTELETNRMSSPVNLRRGVLYKYTRMSTAPRTRHPLNNVSSITPIPLFLSLTTHFTIPVPSSDLSFTTSHPSLSLSADYPTRCSPSGRTHFPFLSSEWISCLKSSASQFSFLPKSFFTTFLLPPENIEKFALQDVCAVHGLLLGRHCSSPARHPPHDTLRKDTQVSGHLILGTTAIAPPWGIN